MSSSQNPSSPPPAYNNTAPNGNTAGSTPPDIAINTTEVLPNSANTTPPTTRIPNITRDASSNEKQNLIGINVQNPITEPSTTNSTESSKDKLVSKLEQVLQSLEKETVDRSPEEQLVSRLENVIYRIGEAKEQRDDRKPIKFKDAVGRTFSFPYYRCETWIGMEDLIKQAFIHVDTIGPHVMEGHYDLMNPAGEVILPSVWGDHVKPGWSISMSMWPMAPPKPRGPPPPPVHVIVDQLPPRNFIHSHPPPPPPPPPGFYDRHPHIGRRRSIDTLSTSSTVSIVVKKKGIRGLWQKVKGIFSKKKSRDYDSDTSSLVDD